MGKEKGTLFTRELGLLFNQMIVFVQNLVRLG